MKSFKVLDIDYRGPSGNLKIKIEANWLHLSIFVTVVTLFVCAVSR